MNFSIIKIPFDACIVEKERRGASKGPDTIEAELKNFFKFGKIENNIEFAEIKEKNDFKKLAKEVEKAAADGYKEKKFVIGLGGDHSVAYGLMRAFAKNFPNSGLIYFDAHLDCEDDFLPPTHEDLIRAAVNEGFFGPKNILMVGSRKFYPKERAFIKALTEQSSVGPSRTSSAREKGIKLGKLGDIQDFTNDKNNLYISIDIDVFDPEFAPGTGYPEKDGLKPEEFLPAIKDLIKSGKVRGADIVEVNPPKDVNNMTAKLAAKILLEFLK